MFRNLLNTRVSATTCWLRSVFGKRYFLWIAGGIIWLGASCGGVTLLTIHANSPGPTQRPFPRWPIDTSITLSKHGDTLLLFAHPRCPCTRATLGELEKIVARSPGSVTPWVVFFRPSGSDETWDQTDLRTTAEAIPGVHVVSDVDGVEAQRFNAKTSGETVLYNQKGELLFSGGITMARGHAGDNIGRSAIESYLVGVVPDCRHTPVFGCPIARSAKSLEQK